MTLKKLTIYIASAMLISLAVVSCNQKTADSSDNSGVAHYRHLQFSETPYDLERGLYELSAEEANSINNYKFTWDDQGRLLSVEFVRGDELLGYSSMGGAARITYTYEDNKQIKHFFNKDNEQIESSGVFTAQYMLDDEGTRTGLMFLDRDGNMVENRNNIHSYSWSKLDNGMIKELRYNLAGEETVMNQFCPFYELRFEYNEKGYVTQMSNYQADTLYNCTAENCGDIGVSYFYFTSNDNGALESFAVHNTIGQLSNLYWGWAKRLNTVDENGYIVETAMFDQDDEYLGGRNVPVTRYAFDDHGAVKEVMNMDSDRNIINHPVSGIAITEYKYDEKGQRVETVRYDKEKNIVTQ